MTVLASFMPLALMVYAVTAIEYKANWSSLMHQEVAA
jgi:hypothetical protein